MKTKKQKHFGKSWYQDNQINDLRFPKHLTPKIIHSALFVYNAPTKEDTTKRVEFLAKEIGDENMSYVMALLVLPTLMNNMQQSTEYTDWKQSRTKTLN